MKIKLTIRIFFLIPLKFYDRSYVDDEITFYNSENKDITEEIVYID